MTQTTRTQTTLTETMLAKTTLTIAASAILLLAGLSSAQTAKPGVVTPLSSVKWESDDTKCLSSATENGDPDTGPSTLILKAAPSCDIPWHYHTAEEQLIVSQGTVQTEMDGMPPASLAPGGFAMMPSQVKHRFSCESKTECILFVTFDRKYDIVWVKVPVKVPVKDKSQPGNGAK